MATYLELRDLFSDGDLANKIDMAIVIAANDLLAGTPTTAEQKWAAHVFSSPRTEGSKALMATLATNKGLDTSVILAASDAVIQTAVDSVVDTLVIAYIG